MRKKTVTPPASRKSKKASTSKTSRRNVRLNVSRAERGSSRKRERDRESTEELTRALTKAEQREKQLRESEGRLRALLETAAQGLLGVLADGRIDLVNRSAEKMFGYHRREMLGQPIEMLLPDNLRTRHTRHRRDFFAHPRTRLMGQGLDLFARRKDGTTFPVEISLSHIEPEDDIVAVAFISDITERKRAEEARRVIEERFRIAAECGNDLIYEWNLKSSVLEWWGDIEACLGYRPRTLEVFEKALHPEDHDRVMGAVQRHLDKGEPFAQEYRVRAKDGTYHCWWDQGMALRDAQGKPYKWTGACTDVTERKQAEEALRRSHQELRSLTARLISAQEGVYKHLSRELHDVFSQKLAILGMHVSELERKLSAAGVSTEEGFGPIGEQISGLASEIHGISRRLHPAILDDLGLAVALKNECLAFSREHGIKVEFHAESVPLSLSNDVALCLYRVAQESLNNIQKHADTSKARLTLAGAPGEIMLSIEDFGKGFQPEEVRGKGGLGLVSMEERVRLVDGLLTIRSEPGDGTVVQIRVPLKRPGRRRGKQ